MTAAAPPHGLDPQGCILDSALAPASSGDSYAAAAPAAAASSQSLTALTVAGPLCLGVA
jgi:hypothetical protein